MRTRSLILFPSALVLAAAGYFFVPGMQPDSLPAGTPPTATAPASTPRPATLPRNDLPGLTNFAQISPSLYRGAQPTAEGFTELKKMGIKTIVNLRLLHSDRDKLKGLGLQYVHIESRAEHPESEDIVAFLQVVTDPANQPVFVHCQAGADRTGCAVAAYRMVIEGWTADDAIAELGRFGHHPVFYQIKHYLSRFNEPAVKAAMKTAKPPKVEVVD